MSEKMELADDISTQDAMREMGQLVDPVQEALRGMLHEFGDEHYHTCPADNDSGPCDCFAGNLIIKAKAALLAALRASPAEGEAVDGEAAIRAAASDASPCAQIVRFEGDLLVYYSGFNLSKFVRFLPRTPRAAVSPPQREAMIEAARWAICKQAGGAGRNKCTNNCGACIGEAEAAADAILALYPAGDGREADSLSGDEGKSE